MKTNQKQWRAIALEDEGNVQKKLKLEDVNLTMKVMTKKKKIQYNLNR